MCYQKLENTVLIVFTAHHLNKRNDSERENKQE